VRAFSESTRFYTGTRKGYYALNQVYPERFIAKPIVGFDQRTFIHDKTVLKLRLFIESNLPGANWISERKLKSSTELACGLNSTDIPDGVFDHPTLGRVAFELEIAHKNQTRYQKKVKRYVHLMRSKDIPNKFNCVIFVCLKDTVKSRLKKESGIYGSMFQVLSIEEFQSHIQGHKNGN
jgi:hypothetical protein